MATLTLSNSFNNDWPPDTLAGGTITSRSATSMTYTSDKGYDITLTGTGLTYDADGTPSGGTLGGVLIEKAGVTFADYAGISVDFTRASMFLFGYDEQNGGHKGSDPYGFVQNALRGADLITGSSGNDDIRGGTGNDTIHAGSGNDYVADEAGNDSLDGGDGYDTLSFDEANYRWETFRGINLDAALGTVIDSWGNTNHFSNFEQFRDTSFSDVLKGSASNEDFVINRGDDVVDGRGGFDFVNYDQADRWGAHHGVNVNLATGVAIDSWGGHDTLTNVEGIRGTIFNDTFTGGAGDEIFLGGKGVDSANGGGGFDQLVFWSVGDNNDGGHGVVIDLTKAANVVDDGYGNAETALNFEFFVGSSLNDKMTGDANMNELGGNDGNDTINGGGGEDNVHGDRGNDVVIGGLGNDHINGGEGNDTLTGGGGGDQFNFQGPLSNQGIDTITDMQAGIDNIWIDSAWGGGFTLDHLVAGQLHAGAGFVTATTAAQRVIYNTTNGNLYFDADGVGGAAAVLFAHLANHAALTINDFNVFL